NGVTLSDSYVTATVKVPARNLNIVGILSRYQGPGDSNAYLGGISWVRAGNLTGYYAGIWVWDAAKARLTPGSPYSRIKSVRLFGFSGSGTIRFETVGSTLRLFVNNVLKVQAVSTRFPNPGGIAVRVTLAGTIDNVVISATKPVIDTFNRKDSS